MGPPERLKLGTFPFCWISPPVPLPSLDHRPHIGKKVALIAFKQILRNNLSAVYIFSNIIMTNLKKLIVNKSLNTKQCPAGLSSRIIPLNLYGKPCGYRRISTNSQKFINFPHFSNLLILLNNLHLPLSKVSFLLHQIAIFISSPYTSFICSCSHCCCIIFFNFRLYMYTHVMLILINQCLLNFFSITKALNGQISH